MHFVKSALTYIPSNEKLGGLQEMFLHAFLVNQVLQDSWDGLRATLEHCKQSKSGGGEGWGNKAIYTPEQRLHFAV